MVQRKLLVMVGLVMFLALVAVAQTEVRPEGSPPQRIVIMQAQPQPPGGPGPGYQPMMDPKPGPSSPGGPGPGYQVMMDSKPGPISPGGPGPLPVMRMREYAEQLRARAREAQELADRLRRQADELDQILMRQTNRGPGPQNMGRFQPMPSGPGMNEPQEMKQQIERLRAEADKAKQEGRIEDSQRIWKEADRMEQQLRGPGPGQQGGFGKPMPPEVQDILRAAEQAQREGRMEDARKQREKAEMVAREWEQQQRGQGRQQMGPRGDERQGIKEKIGRLREESQRAKEQNRFEDAERLWKDADRLEQQLREPGQGPKQPGAQLKDDLKRSLEEIKQEIGKLWQAVNEMRNRPREGRPS